MEVLDNEAIKEKVNSHETRLNRHEQMLAALKAADAQLEQNIKDIREHLTNGFADIHKGLQEVHDKALTTVPGDVVKRLSNHSLVWQITGAALVIILAVAFVVAR